MERNIAHAPTLESGETLRITGKPNRRKDTPRPRSKASPTAKKMKNGIWPAVGSTPTSAGGDRTGPRKEAGIPTAAGATGSSGDDHGRPQTDSRYPGSGGHQRNLRRRLHDLLLFSLAFRQRRLCQARALPTSP